MLIFRTLTAIRAVFHSSLAPFHHFPHQITLACSGRSVQTGRL